MFKHIFLIPLAGIAVIILSLTASPSHAGPLTTPALIGDLEQAVGTDTILVEEGNRRPKGANRERAGRKAQRSQEGNRRPRRAERSRSERKVQRSERRARKAERKSRKAQRSRSERRASRSERRARKAERRRDRRRDEARRHDRRKHANKRHRRKHKHKRHRRHRSFGFYGYGGLNPYFPYGGYSGYDSYGGYDYGSYDPYYEPPRRSRISCKRARKKLRRNGYRRMRAYDCRGKVYGFYAWRGKHRYKIRISAYTSRILVANRIRR